MDHSQYDPPSAGPFATAASIEPAPIIEPVCDWFSAKRAINAGTDACVYMAEKCAAAAAGASDALMLTSAETWRVHAAVLRSFVRQYESGVAGKPDTGEGSQPLSGVRGDPGAPGTVTVPARDR